MSILSVSHTLMPPRIGSSARARSRKAPRIGKSVSIREARGRRTSSSRPLPAGLKKALILTSAGMSWAAAGDAMAQASAQTSIAARTMVAERRHGAMFWIQRTSVLIEAEGVDIHLPVTIGPRHAVAGKLRVGLGADFPLVAHAYLGPGGHFQL